MALDTGIHAGMTVLAEVPTHTQRHASLNFFGEFTTLLDQR